MEWDGALCPGWVWMVWLADRPTDGPCYYPQAATEKDADVCVTGIVGCAGLLPTVEAIKAKKTIALANKETLISGGPAILPLLKEHGVNVIPADSEHSAIFQSLQVRTCSRGVFAFPLPMVLG